jgi:hypothetical protein
MSAATNALIVTTLALEAATRAAELNAILARAAKEGREVSDEEVAQARTAAAAAVDRLEQAG